LILAFVVFNPGDLYYLGYKKIIITIVIIKNVKVAYTRLPELIPVLSSQPASDVSHKPDGRLPLLSARPAVIPATLKRAATNFAAW